jgi:hypothetical protein
MAERSSPGGGLFVSLKPGTLIPQRRNAMGFGDKYNAAKQRLEAAQKGLPLPANTVNGLLVDLGKKGEKLLASNIEDNEEVLAKLKGDFGQGFVVTTKHIYIVKWGFQTGLTFGGKCVSFAHASITGLQLKKHALTQLVQVLTPANQDNKRLSAWATRGKDNSALESDNAVTFSRADTELFQQAVKLGREMMTKAQGGVQAATDDMSQLERLAELKDKGVISEREFTAKKKQILGL